MWLSLLPSDGQLSVTDHARNATLAIVGVVLYLLATAIQLLSIWRVVMWPRIAASSSPRVHCEIPMRQ
jgi:hypothetical protein